MTDQSPYPFSFVAPTTQASLTEVRELLEMLLKTDSYDELPDSLKEEVLKELQQTFLAGFRFVRREFEARGGLDSGTAEG